MRQVLGAGALGRPRGLGWETHVNPWLIHVNVWQKPLQYCKVISLQLINEKINKLKNNNKIKNADLFLCITICNNLCNYLHVKLQYFSSHRLKERTYMAFLTLTSRDFPGGSDGKVSAYNAGNLGSIPGWGRFLEKLMATHSNTLAWKIPQEEPGRLQSMGSQRVRHD